MKRRSFSRRRRSRKYGKRIRSVNSSRGGIRL